MKKLTIGLVALLCCALLPLKANDACVDALPILCGDNLLGSTAAATADAADFCGTSNTAPGVWYAFTATQDASINVSTCNQAGYDTKLGVFTGTCGALVCEGGNDDGPGCSGFTSSFTFNATTGTTYYILVHGFGSASGDFELSLTCTVATGYDACSGALPIDCGQTVSGSTSGATFDGVGTCGTSNTAPGVWYTYTAAADGLVTASTCDQAGYDTKLSVFSGTCGSLTCEGGNDDGPNCSGFSSKVTFVATAGTTYSILVHGFGSATGDFDLTLTCAPLSTNDSPCGASALLLEELTDFTNVGATADPGEVTPGAGTTPGATCTSTDGWCSFETEVQNSVWFTFVAPASGCVSMAAGPGDYQMAVWSVEDCGDYSTFTEIAANDDLGGFNFGPQLSPLSCLTPGETYYIQIDGFAGFESDGLIIVVDCGTEPFTCDAGGCQTSYQGYAPAEGPNYLSASGSGGFPPYSYAWSGPNITSDPNYYSVSVEPTATTTYYVVVTDASGCSRTCEVTVEVEDLTCGKKGDKVRVNHVPPGNPNNNREICISADDVADYLDDHPASNLGSADNACTEVNPPPAPCSVLEIFVTTDAFGEEFSLTLTDLDEGYVIGVLPFNTLPDNGTFLITSDCIRTDHCYELFVEDGFGDGICCDWGNGNYFYVFDGDTTFSPSGGDYGASETTTFGDCVAPRLAKEESIITDMEKTTIKSYPNPFSNTATIQFVPAVDGHAVLEVVDMSGRVVAVPFDGNVTKGNSVQTTFDGNNAANGIYMYRLLLDNEVYHGKMILAR